MTAGARHDSLGPLLASLGFNSDDGAKLLQLGHWMELPPGEVLLSRNKPAPYLGFIESGEVELLIRPAGRERPVRVASIGAGQIVGWEPLVGESRSTFEAQTVTHTRLFVVSTDLLETLREREPEIISQLCGLALQTMRSVEKAGRELP